MVIRARLERATYCLEGNCSIQLSYRTIGMTCIEGPKLAKSIKNSKYVDGEAPK